jgi:uncharacterized PurR-regulated membrane protein YhhQ (DUF165 family)
MIWVLGYIGSIVLVNVLFAHAPEYSAVWALIVGLIFVVRDFAQRAVGHWILAAMALAVALSHFMADPFVAVASVCAFAVAELVDWAVYSISKRQMAERVLISSAVSAPADTLIFLGMVGILTPELFALQVASKMAGALLVSFGIWKRSHA